MYLPVSKRPQELGGRDRIKHGNGATPARSTLLYACTSSFYLFGPSGCRRFSTSNTVNIRVIKAMPQTMRFAWLELIVATLR